MKLFASPSYIAAALLGVLIAVLLAPFAALMTDAGWDAYDRAYPVASVKAVRVPAPPGEIMLTMTTTKHRQCELLRVLAYDKAPDGVFVRARIEKMTEAELETLSPGETVRSAIWRVWPVTGTSIAVWAEHDCAGRVVRTKLFEMGTGDAADQ